MKKGCIIGVGAIGPIHAVALDRIGGLYGICDNQPDRLSGFYPDNENLHRYSDYEEVLSDVDVDVVHICTPHYLHKDMTIAALRQGKSVVLEKPVAMNKAEFDELYKIAEKAENKVCVMFQNRTNPAIKALKSFLETNNSLGKLKGITGILTWNRNAEYYLRDSWRGKWNTEGGGLLINQAIHTIDLLGYLGGKIDRVRGSISNKTLEGVIEVEDTADAIFETEAGMKMCFYATNGCGYSRPLQLEVQMEHGLLRYADNRLYKIADDSCEVLAYDSRRYPGKDCWGNGHQEVIEEFYKYLETGEGEYITLSDAAPAMKTLYAFYESAKTNKEVLV